MPNYRFTLEYDGAGFAGWQAQAGGQRTVQDEFEAAIERVTGQRLRVAGSGRTDAGVGCASQRIHGVNIREGLDVVDDRGLTKQSLGGGVGRANAVFGAPSFQRGDQGRLLTADVGAGTGDDLELE